MVAAAAVMVWGAAVAVGVMTVSLMTRMRARASDGARTKKTRTTSTEKGRECVASQGLSKRFRPHQCRHARPYPFSCPWRLSDNTLTASRCPGKMSTVDHYSGSIPLLSLADWRTGSKAGRMILPARTDMKPSRDTGTGRSRDPEISTRLSCGTVATGRRR